MSQWVGWCRLAAAVLCAALSGSRQGSLFRYGHPCILLAAAAYVLIDRLLRAVPHLGLTIGQGERATQLSEGVEGMSRRTCKQTSLLLFSNS